MGVQWDNAPAISRLQKAYESVKREILYNILFEFGMPKKVVRLIKMCFLKPIAQSV
jgi:hypothetical protein